MPCGDKEECNYDSLNKLVFSATEHSDHHDETETCSPFCICACCGQIISFHFIQESSISDLIIFEKKIYSYVSPTFAEISFSFWQPPKIS
jgi:hypothetical protein